MLCKNSRCMAQLGDHHWGDGYCSSRCMRADAVTEPRADGPLMDPTDPTGKQEIARNRDEIDAMLALAEIDPRLPRIVYMRKRRVAYREIGRKCGMGHMAVARLLQSVTPNLLHACGLRNIRPVKRVG